MLLAEFSRNQIFASLPEPHARLLFETGEVSTFPAGATLIREGDTLDRLYILLRGRVEVFLPEAVNRVSAVRLTQLGPGDCFGEYAFIDHQPASATIQAIEDAEIYSIPYDKLQQFLDSHPSAASLVYQNLLRILVRRLRTSNAELDLFTLSF